MRGQVRHAPRPLQAVALADLPDLVPRLHDEIGRSGLPGELCRRLRDRLEALSSGSPSRTCHFDLHPDNIIVSARGWVVIDWLTATNGPPIADLARTLLLRANTADPVMAAFIAAVQRTACDRRGFDPDTLTTWTPVLAGARLAEGFTGPYADWLSGLATDQA